MKLNSCPGENRMNSGFAKNEKMPDGPQQPAVRLSMESAPIRKNARECDHALV